MHREANTLGSKSATLELTRISVDMKVLIEQMREQIQNIEYAFPGGVDGATHYYF